MPTVESGDAASDVVRPTGGRDKIAVESARVGYRHVDQGIALRFYRRLKMIVSDLRHNHMPFAVPGGGPLRRQRERAQHEGEEGKGRPRKLLKAITIQSGQSSRLACRFARENQAAHCFLNRKNPRGCVGEMA